MNCQRPENNMEERVQRRSLPDGISIDLNRSASNRLIPGNNGRATGVIPGFLAQNSLGPRAMGLQAPILQGTPTLFIPTRPRNLSFTTQDAAKRSVMELLARHNTPMPAIDDHVSLKVPVKIMTEVPLPLMTKKTVPTASPLKKRGFSLVDIGAPPVKKPRAIGDTAAAQKILNKTLEDFSAEKKEMAESDSEINKIEESVLPANESRPVSPVVGGAVVDQYNDDDVLCGRGGGTNVHPGNRRFRDLINAHRCRYLKAKKNDKPAISRSIVAAIRRANGRFLKKDEKSGKWVEIGDDGAREKTSQALRQRAPEMRRILFEGEQRMAEEEIRRRSEEAAAAAQRVQVTAAVYESPAHHTTANTALSLPALQARSNAIHHTELAKTALFRSAIMGRQQSVVHQPATAPSSVNVAAANVLLARRMAMLWGTGMGNLNLPPNNP